ncbi:hypothetical protein AB4305_06395 [Nocardia sp. 2YAB30]|uniref:hypothetical protein n=1 Tax=unclassified Nocardia TaxID=2637762 RepID=UPI003F9D3C61
MGWNHLRRRERDDLNLLQAQTERGESGDHAEPMLRQSGADRQRIPSGPAQDIHPALGVEHHRHAVPDRLIRIQIQRVDHQRRDELLCLPQPQVPILRVQMLDSPLDPPPVVLRRAAQQIPVPFDLDRQRDEAIVVDGARVTRVGRRSMDVGHDASLVRVADYVEWQLDRRPTDSDCAGGVRQKRTRGQQADSGSH